MSCLDGNSSHFILCLLQNQQHDIEVEIETQKSHRRHFETRLRELQDSIRKAEREHETMKKLVRVGVWSTVPPFLSTRKLVPMAGAGKNWMERLPQPKLCFISQRSINSAGLVSFTSISVKAILH